MNISERELTFWSTICAIFSELFIKLASAYRFSYRSLNLRFYLQSQKTISLLLTMTISLNTQKDDFVYRSVLETTINAYFPSKKSNYTAINSFFLKLSTLTIAKFIISTRTDITFQTSVEQLRVITMCSAFTTDCGYNGSTINLIGDVYCPNTKSLGKRCMHKKKLFNLTAEVIINACIARLCVRFAIFLLKIKNTRFFVAWPKGLHF